ncbi:MAG TPA: class I tRNA ligase family protein, partial [Eubacteriales bacterium]|nr:class I tRNA ligase family protein [Eubacteriales bacterium]
RLYLMFGFSYIEGGPWNDKGLESVVKFMERVERLFIKSKDVATPKKEKTAAEKELAFVIHSTIKSVTKDMEDFSFNTAIARLMELTNALYAYDNAQTDKHPVFKEGLKTLLHLMAPLTPHFCEELNELTGGTKSVFCEKYPVCDESALVRDEVELAVQINSRVKAKITVPASFTDAEIEAFALSTEAIKNLIGGAEVKKVIIIKNRLINIVI